MADKKTVIRKTNLDGKLITVPVRTITSAIPTQINLYDNLNLGENIIFTELSRLFAIVKEKGMDSEIAYIFSALMKTQLMILQMKKAELKDLDIDNMPMDQLMKHAEQFLAKGAIS